MVVAAAAAGVRVLQVSLGLVGWADGVVGAVGGVVINGLVTSVRVVRTTSVVLVTWPVVSIATVNVLVRIVDAAIIVAGHSPHVAIRT